MLMLRETAVGSCGDILFGIWGLFKHKPTIGYLETNSKVRFTMTG